jgi:hypothetical protein
MHGEAAGIGECDRRDHRQAPIADESPHEGRKDPHEKATDHQRQHAAGLDQMLPGLIEGGDVAGRRQFGKGMDRQQPEPMQQRVPGGIGQMVEIAGVIEIFLRPPVIEQQTLVGQDQILVRDSPIRHPESEEKE